MKKIALLASVVFLSGCLFSGSTEPVPEEAPFVPVAAPEEVQEPAGELSDASEGMEMEEAPGESNIVVSSPLEGGLLTTPMTVSGTARAFENTVNVDVKNARGDVVISEVVNVHGADVGQFGEFSVNIHFQFSGTKEGSVEVYSISAKDGSQQDLVSIPVKFDTGE